MLQYRDNEGDLVTIGCDEDLKALFNWPTQNSNNKQHMVHLFIVSRSSVFNFFKMNLQIERR